MLLATNPIQRKVLIEIDGSQAEARVVARLCTALAGKSRFDDVFLSGRLIHKVIASIIYKVPEESVQKDNTPGSMYYTAKRAMHAYDNGMGPQKFAILTRKTVWEAKLLLETCAKEFPEVVNHFHPWCIETAKKDRTMVNAYGRPHTFLDKWDDELFRRLFTYFQQSSIGDHVKLAMSDFDDLKQPVWETDLLMESHDAFAYQVLAHPQYIWDSFHLAKSLMERPFPVLQLTLSVPAEGGMGRSWRYKYSFKTAEDVERLLRKLRYTNAEATRLHQGLHDTHRGPRSPRDFPLLDSPRNPSSSSQAESMDR